MSFGVVQSAISIIKNNRNLISKRDKFKNTLVSKNAKVEFKSRNATPLELKRLRERLQRENKKIFIKRIVATAIVMIVLLMVFLSIVNL